MAKKERDASADNPKDSEAIAAALHRLADAVLLLRDVIADVREDVHWVTHNGLPLQPIVHTVVKRMARDPCAANWSEQLSVEHYSYPPDTSEMSPDATPVDRFREELESTIEAAMQGQLETLLTVLDGVRDEILAALKRRDTAKETPAPAIEQPPSTTAATPVVPSRRSPQRDRLF
jgi:hypothetical protein